MKVAVYYSNSDIRLEEVPIPKIGEGEILVKVNASGICGTDVMEWYRKKKVGTVMGHEIAGIIEESKSDKYQKGQRVFVSHHVPCDECKFCKEGNHTACETLHKGNYDPGGYSEYIRVPKLNVEKGVYVLPDDMTFEEGTMIEPLACCVRGQRILDIKPDHTALILGSGVSGLMNIQLAKLKGATVIATDINEYRLKKAAEYGADAVLNAKEDLKIKADRIIVCTGAKQAVQQAYDCMEKKGKLLFFAIPSTNPELPMTKLWRNEWTIISSYGAAPIDLEEALQLIKDKRVDMTSLITDKLPLEKIQEGFKIVASANKSLKVVLEP